MQNSTGCRINVSGQTHGNEREISLQGTPDAIARARRAIEDRVEAMVRNNSVTLFRCENGFHFLCPITFITRHDISSVMKLATFPAKLFLHFIFIFIFLILFFYNRRNKTMINPITVIATSNNPLDTISLHQLQLVIP